MSNGGTITERRSKLWLVQDLPRLLLIAAFALLVAGLPPLFVFGAGCCCCAVGFVAKFAGHINRLACLPACSTPAFRPQVLAFLRGDDQDGLSRFCSCLRIVWATDIFAYFVGRSLGGPKLAPSISPGKTWSGAVGGIAAAVAAGLAVAAWFGPAGNPVVSGCHRAWFRVWSQMGDLFESWVKRQFGVKDSGTMIPGHGGMMDRVDGLVAAASALYVR